MSTTLAKPTAPAQRLRVLGVVLLAAAAVGLAWWMWQGAALIEAALAAPEASAVGRYLELHRQLDPEQRDLAYFLEYGVPVLYRFFGLLGLAGGLVVGFADRIVEAVRRYVLQPASATGLAAARIVVFGAMLVYFDLGEAVRMSALPEVLLAPPPGWGALLPLLPIDPTLTLAMGWLWRGLCLMALLGVAYRYAAWGTVLLGVYVMGIAQLYGKIDHYHHLLWFGAMLAASPAAAALRLGSWRGPQASALRYGVPLRLGTLLLGVLYFFSGFWKYVIGGLDWAVSDNLRLMLYAQWHRLDWLPAVRVDEWPGFIEASGLGVMLVEMGFVFALFHPRLRRLAIAGALVMHAAIAALMHIVAWPTVAMYVFFWRERTSADQQTSPMPKASRRVGWALIVVNGLCGVLLIDSWPFAVYPTFASVEQPYRTELVIETTAPDSTIDTFSPRQPAILAAYKGTRLMGLLRRVAWTEDPELQQQRAEALLAVLTPLDLRLQNAQTVRMYQNRVAVHPARWDEARSDQKMIVTLSSLESP
ncbi:MAG: hypothetical protein AAF730_08780 [Bacteroidota bacterium]